MSGTINSNIQRMDAVQQALDEYENQHGLPKLHAPGTEDELQQYLSMPRNVLEKLTKDQCAEIAYRLSQFAFYIQRLYNREQSRLSWSKKSLHKYIADYLSTSSNQQFNYVPFESKIAILARQDQEINKIYGIYYYADQRIRRLEFLSTSIKHLAETILAIGRNK